MAFFTTDNERKSFLITSSVFIRSEEHTSELQSRPHLVCRLLLEKKKRSRLFFVAWVTLEDDYGQEFRHRIVGPAEFDMSDGYISIDAPLARAMMPKILDEELSV